MSVITTLAIVSMQEARNSTMYVTIHFQTPDSDFMSRTYLHWPCCTLSWADHGKLDMKNDSTALKAKFVLARPVQVHTDLCLLYQSHGTNTNIPDMSEFSGNGNSSESILHGLSQVGKTST